MITDSIRRRTELRPGGEVAASGRDSNMVTRDCVYYVHMLCAIVVSGSGSR